MVRILSIITSIYTLVSISGDLLVALRIQDNRRSLQLNLVLLPLPGPVLLHVRCELGLLLRGFLKVCMMPLEVSPQACRLFEGFRTL